MPKKNVLQKEARQWGIRFDSKWTKPRLERAIAEAKEAALEEPEAEPEVEVEPEPEQHLGTGGGDTPYVPPFPANPPTPPVPEPDHVPDAPAPPGAAGPEGTASHPLGPTGSAPGGMEPPVIARQVIEAVVVPKPGSEPEVVAALAPAPPPAPTSAPVQAPASPPAPDQWPAGHYRTICNIGNAKPGQVIKLDDASAKSLGAQGAIERI